MKNDIFEEISPDEALEILRQITKTDKKLKKKIVELAESLFRNINVDEVCGEVFFELDVIDVHELWDRAGSSTNGYTSPEEMAVEMFEEALEPFIQEMYRLLDLEMYQEAKLYCMGIAKGIYQYEEDSTSEFKDWAADVPVESYNNIFYEWEKRGIDVKDKKEMRAFLGDACPNWS